MILHLLSHWTSNTIDELHVNLWKIKKATKLYFSHFPRSSLWAAFLQIWYGSHLVDVINYRPVVRQSIQGLWFCRWGQNLPPCGITINTLLCYRATCQSIPVFLSVSVLSVVLFSFAFYRRNLLVFFASAKSTLWTYTVCASAIV